MVIFPNCKCCGTCSVSESSSGQQGTFVKEYVFPAAEHCILFTRYAYSIPDQFIVEIGGVVALDTGPVDDSYVFGSQEYCLTKPAGVTSVKVTVVAPLENTVWDYFIECDKCCPDCVITCGASDLSTSACCLPEETCCLPDRGRTYGGICCSPETTCCSGPDNSVCCEDDQTCCVGAFTSACCDPGVVCCGTGNEYIGFNHQCCQPGQVCCETTTPDYVGGLLTVCCASGKCCSDDEGNTTCCASDEVCIYGTCTQCDCPPGLECCNSDENGDVDDVCCSPGYCCGVACCDAEAEESCCATYDQFGDVLSQQCCPTDKCCDGTCCGENEDCVETAAGLFCLERCGECIDYTFGPVELDQADCVRNVLDTIEVSVPEGCGWMVITGEADDYIEIDGDSFFCTSGTNYPIIHSRAVSVSVTLYLVSYYGGSASANIKICFYTEGPPP